MSSSDGEQHADTVQRIRSQLHAELAREFDALLGEITEKQQRIEWLSKEAARAYELEAANQRLRDVLERISRDMTTVVGGSRDYTVAASRTALIAREALRGSDAT
jgi:hypothetical protein